MWMQCFSVFIVLDDPGCKNIYVAYFFCIYMFLLGTVKGKKKKRGGQKQNTLLRTGQGWTLLPPLGLLKIGLGGRGLL